MSDAEHKEEETSAAAPDESSTSLHEELATTSLQPQEPNKITLLLRSAGNAPIMKKTKWVVEPNKSVSWVVAFIRKYLKLQPSESLFLYVNQSFAPSPDQLLRNLYDCFSTDGKLIFHYCKSPAWG